MKDPTLPANFGGGTATAVAVARYKDQDWRQLLNQIAELHTIPTPLYRDVMDRTLALIALVVTAPIMLLIALIIRLDSPGPALFRQKRIGQGGKLFDFVKFRTYYRDAKQRFPELYDYRIQPEALHSYRFKVPNDPRATRVGQWLRQSTLDELPNFWNVLTGKMALVGPRPEIPEFLPNYSYSELRIFTIRPGVTGFAQISGRGWLTFPETKKWDMAHLENRGLMSDLRVLFATVARVIFRHGAF
jgi:lipopolysaccharide/colanic/teichoic acid biosynthesis glycosyltransferase